MLVALQCKLARIMFALLKYKRYYDPKGWRSICLPPDSLGLKLTRGDSGVSIGRIYATTDTRIRTPTLRPDIERGIVRDLLR